MKKKQRNKEQEMNLAYKGMVPWSRDEFNWIEAEFHRLKDEQNKRGKSKTGKLATIETEDVRFNCDNLLLLMEVFHKRYSNQVELMAHFIRHQQILDFLRTCGNDLIQEGLIEVNGPRTIYSTALIDTLCFIPLTQEKLGPNGDKIYTFSYKEVVNAAKVRQSAHLN